MSHHRSLQQDLPRRGGVCDISGQYLLDHRGPSGLRRINKIGVIPPAGCACAKAPGLEMKAKENGLSLIDVLQLLRRIRRRTAPVAGAQIVVEHHAAPQAQIAKQENSHGVDGKGPTFVLEAKEQRSVHRGEEPAPMVVSGVPVTKGRVVTPDRKLKPALGAPGGLEALDIQRITVRSGLKSGLGKKRELSQVRKHVEVERAQPEGRRGFVELRARIQRLRAEILLGVYIREKMDFGIADDGVSAVFRPGCRRSQQQPES